MTTLEEKLNLIMEYIVAGDAESQYRLREKIMQVLCEDCDNATPAKNPVYILDDMIDELLRELGTPCHVSGYDQIIYAINLAVTDDKYIRQMTDLLYPEVAKKFNSTPARVERNIRHAVNLTFSGIYGSDEAYDLFKNTVSKRSGKPTNT